MRIERYGVRIEAFENVELDFGVRFVGDKNAAKSVGFELPLKLRSQLMEPERVQFG